MVDVGKPRMINAELEDYDLEKQQQQESQQSSNLKLVKSQKKPSKKPKLNAAKEEGVGDIIVHQAIETIEFVLGGIAHTASYLRLWALSLAHSQLASVFFRMTVGAGLAGGSFFMIALEWYVFIGATFFVLMLMDTMECCLHALRLHW